MQKIREITQHILEKSAKLNSIWRNFTLFSTKGKNQKILEKFFELQI